MGVVLSSGCIREELNTYSVRINGRTGYRESICDIPCQDEEIDCYRVVETVMRNDETGDYYVIVKSIDPDNNCARILYTITADNLEYSRVSFEVGDERPNHYVNIGDKIVSISTVGTSIISSEDGSLIAEVANDINPLSADVAEAGYVIEYSDHITIYSSDGEELSRVNGDFGYYSNYSDSYFEVDGKSYLVACSGVEYDYYAIDFDTGYCNYLFNNNDLGVDFWDCYGQFVFNDIGEYYVDPLSRSTILLAEWNNINSRPGGNEYAGNRYYYTFGNDLFVKAYIDSDNTTAIQIYEYDNTIDYSDREIITVGGIGMFQDTAINLAVYEYNTSQDEYRIQLVEFENEAESAVEELERNSRLISDFNSGNAPDIFYGNNFDYGYFGRNDSFAA